MVYSKWVYRLSDGMLLPRGGFYNPEFDPVIEGIIFRPDHDPHPDRRLLRVNVPGAANHDPAIPHDTLILSTVAEQNQFDLEDPNSKREKARDRLLQKKKARNVGILDLPDILTYLGIED